MSVSKYKGARSASTPATTWRFSRSEVVVWCRTASAWRRVRRWRFAQEYATATVSDIVVARGFFIPARKETFARRSLGLPFEKRRRTARQAANDARLRARAAAGSLGPRPSVQQRQYIGEEIARQEVQP